jgi:hypothetical protein
MSLLPGKHNFVIWQGATFKKRINLFTDANAEVPWNLTGYSALLEIRPEPKSTTVLFTLSTANNRIDLGDTNGTIDLLIDDTDTAELPWTAGVYDLTITSSGGITDPLLFGGFAVRGV